MIRDPYFEKEFNEKAAYRVFPNRVEKVPRSNVFSLPDWDFWFVEDDTYVCPEMRDAWATQDPTRVMVGSKALVCHVTGRYYAGWMQTVDVPDYGPVTLFASTTNRWTFRNSDTYIDNASLECKNGVLTASVFMHAWSNHAVAGFEHAGRGNCSVGVNCGPVAIKAGNVERWIQNNIPNETKEMKDAVDNFTFRVGLDLEGGKNPLSPNVHWGPSWHVYNGYCQEISVTLREEQGENNKIGPHIIRGASGLGEHLRAGPAVAKFLGDYNMQTHPNTLVIGRVYADNKFDVQECYKQGLDPVQQAERFVYLQQSEYLSNPHIRYWEGPNEPVLWGDDVDDDKAMKWYNDFEKRRIEVMAKELGLKCVIGNFATGTPPLHLWPNFLDCIKFGLNYEVILGLHEYSHPWMWWMTGKYQLDPDEDQGREGWTTLRYRKVYNQFLSPAGIKVPIIITESGVDALVNPKPPGTPSVQWKELRQWWTTNYSKEIPWPGDPDEFYANMLIWYDRQLMEDDYVIGHTVFCWGNYGQEWAKFDVAGTGAANKLTEYVARNPAEPFDWDNYGEKEKEMGYDRFYIIADPTYMDEDQLDDAYARARVEMRTVGPSWNDAVPYAKDRPDEWKTNTVIAGPLPAIDRPRYREWVKDRDPGTTLVFDDDDEDEEYIDLVGKLPINKNSRWYPYKTRELSEVEWVVFHHTAGARVTGDRVIGHIEAIARLHCGGTRNYPGIAYTFMIDDDGKLYRVNDVRTVSFAHGRVNSGRDENRLGIPVCLIGHFNDHRPSEAALATSRKVIKYLNDLTGKDLKVKGHRDLASTDCPGKNTWPWWSETPMLLGLHDTPGGEWMKNNNVKGVCLAHWIVQRTPSPIDLTHLSSTVIGRINWGYSHGTGTLPPPGDRNRFVNAAVSTILNSKGVDYWHVGNEVNNRSEWPGYNSPNLYKLTAGYVIDMYNEIYDAVNGRAKIGPPPLDPYFGPGSNNMDWWKYFLNNMNGADVFFLHLKTQTNNPEEVWSKDKFSDWPLQWQYLHLRAGEPYIKEIPTRYRNLPIYVTELNPQHLDRIGGPMGWKADNTRWVEESVEYFKTQPVDGLVFYRYELAGDQTPFGLANKPAILDKIKELSG